MIFLFIKYVAVTKLLDSQCLIVDEGVVCDFALSVLKKNQKPIDTVFAMTHPLFFVKVKVFTKYSVMTRRTIQSAHLTVDT